MRYFIRFAYLGTDFHGSQTQPNASSVQQTMEEAMATILRTPTPLTFAGRTDAGVHARCMWAHFDAEQALPDNLTHRLNALLPESIAIYDIVRVCADAHARFDATSRTYPYYITTRKDPFAYRTRTRVAPGLDFEAMNRAAELLRGRQDFASFCRIHTDVKTTICDVREAYWTRENECEAYFTITADRFLRNMVRAVVGTLFDVGRGKLSPEQFLAIIHAQSRASAGQSADARGLFLEQIQYPATIFAPFSTK
jgi:tRNA pseudouridine38-40 synthase